MQEALGLIPSIRQKQKEKESQSATTFPAIHANNKGIWNSAFCLEI
jgi:hypothetical protein